MRKHPPLAVSAVRNQYFIGMKGLKSKSPAFTDISLTLIGFETWNDPNPAMIAAPPSPYSPECLQVEASRVVFL